MLALALTIPWRRVETLTSLSSGERTAHRRMAAVVTFRRASISWRATAALAIAPAEAASLSVTHHLTKQQ